MKKQTNANQRQCTPKEGIRASVFSMPNPVKGEYPHRARTMRAPRQVFEQLLQKMVYRERSCRWYLVGSEAIPPDWLWMKGSTEQPQYPHRGRTARAPRQVLPLNLKTHTVSETEHRTSCLTTVSQTITVSSCQSDISDQYPWGASSRSQSAPHMHVLECICSNVRQFHKDHHNDTITCANPPPLQSPPFCQAS